jgi:hypothetical protein
VEEALRTLEALSAEGSSRHVEAMRLALSLRPDRVFLITDAGEMTAAEIAQIRAWNQRGVPLDAVLIGAKPGQASAVQALTGSERARYLPLSPAPIVSP